MNNKYYVVFIKKNNRWKIKERFNNIIDAKFYIEELKYLGYKTKIKAY